MLLRTLVFIVVVGSAVRARVRVGSRGVTNGFGFRVVLCRIFSWIALCQLVVPFPSSFGRNPIDGRRVGFRRFGGRRSELAFGSDRSSVDRVRHRPSRLDRLID